MCSLHLVMDQSLAHMFSLQKIEVRMSMQISMYIQYIYKYNLEIVGN